MKKKKTKSHGKKSKKSKLKHIGDEKEWEKQLRSVQFLEYKKNLDRDLRLSTWAVTNQVGEAIIFTRGLRKYDLLDQYAIGVPQELFQDVAEAMNVIACLQKDENGRKFFFAEGPSIQYCGLHLKLSPTSKDESKFLRNKLDIGFSTSGRAVLVLPRFAGASTWGRLPDAKEGFEGLHQLVLNYSPFVYRHLSFLPNNPSNKTGKIKFHCPFCESKSMKASLHRLMTLNEDEFMVSSCPSLYNGRESLASALCGCGKTYHSLDSSDFVGTFMREHEDHFKRNKEFYNAFMVIASRGKTVQELFAAFRKGSTIQAINDSCTIGIDHVIKKVSDFSCIYEVEKSSSHRDELGMKQKNTTKITQQCKVIKTTTHTNVNYSMASSDEIARRKHSKNLGLVFDEAHNIFKDIRMKIAKHSLKREKPKKRSKKCKSSNDDISFTINNPESIGLGGKAGKVSFLVRIGEESALYKSMKVKPRKAALHTLDLHGYTVKEGQATLDKSLPEWYKMAMESEYPFVIEVKIICGGGAQLLSEMVEKWIRNSRVVARAFE